ncbi:MAG: hypothetical protein E6H52_05515 [Betaproteobacteria bacterium]|nr:MAG: hypothetical protein E6H52_05515 [Betaproteobacteria bacterium]
MKPIVALMITGLLASGAVLAQDSKMAAPAPAASAPSTAAPTGDQPAKKSAHHKRKHKAAIAKTEGDTKKSDMKPSAPMAPMAPATPDTKK